MYNSLIVAGVNDFTKGTADKNGKSPVILNVVAGTCPNRIVISGTVAERAGIQVGKTYLLQCRETKSDAKYGRQFNYSVMDTLSGLQIIESQKSLGSAVIFDASKAEVVSNSNADEANEADAFANTENEFDSQKA